jgi:hypothetical protein
MSTESNDPTRQSPYGQEYGTQPQYTQPAPYGQQSAQPYGQEQYAPQQYEQQQYEQQQYAPQQYGQQQYPAQQYGQQPYGQYGSAVPARPGGVTIAAVFGFIFGACGVLATLAFLVLGAISGGAAGSLEDAIPGFGGFAGALAGALIVIGVLALAWTVVMILGSVRALSGRSRVLLIVGASISILTTGLSFFGSLADENSTAGGIIVSLIFFAMAIAIVVLLSMKPAADFFAAHRARRGR